VISSFGGFAFVRSMNLESITIRHIPPPAWARQPQIHFAGIDAKSGYISIKAHWNELFPQLEGLIGEYLNNPDLTFLNADDGFPAKDRLTGEYYVSDESCHTDVILGRPVCRLSVMFHCLEQPWLAGVEDLDYLELEALVLLWLDTGELEIDPGLNSSSISIECTSVTARPNSRLQRSPRNVYSGIDQYERAGPLNLALAR